ncbi:hypothetical protein ACFLRB_04845 [Acidobacteriota bacterium]
MQLREMIRLMGKPFPKPLPIQPEILAEYFSENGFNSEILDGVLLFNEIYSPGRLSEFKKLLQAKDLDLEVRHSIWTEYEDEDFEKNPLWILLFPDFFIDGLDFKNTCKVCNKSTVVVDLDKRVTRVKSKKPIVSVNGQFTIVKKDLKDKMVKELSGLYFEPFDENEEYFHLLSKSSLGELVNTPDDFIGYNGICPKCKLPVFKMFFGSLAFAQSNWNGDDIVSGDFNRGVFFSEKAYQLIKSVEKEVSRDSVVILKS